MGRDYKKSLVTARHKYNYRQTDKKRKERTDENGEIYCSLIHSPHGKHPSDA